MTLSFRQHAIAFVVTCSLSTWATAVFSQNTAASASAPVAGSSAAPAAQPLALAPFETASPGQLNPRWAVSGLPGNTIALTRFEATVLQGEPVLRISTHQSYGVLTHAWQGTTPPELAWRWQLAQADITTKAGDDAALKVCVMFDQPLRDIPFGQRMGLSLARAASRQALPSATLCYLWDNRYPAGTRGANPYSARVRYIVLNGVETPLGQWVDQRRRLADDFASLFGGESAQMPPVIAVAVGADSDNTGGTSLAYLTRLRWVD